MCTDLAKYFIPEHLAKWRKITREYLFAPIESLGASSDPDAARQEAANLPRVLLRAQDSVQLQRAARRSRSARRVRVNQPKAMMKSFFTLCFVLFAAAVSAQDFAPDAQVKKITDEVISVIKQDQDIRAGNQKKLNELVDAKVLPHFDFSRMTALAVGRHWRKASTEQQQALTSEFRTLLVRTYSGALSTYKNQTIEFKPLRAAAEDTEVTVRTQVKQPGAAPISIDYSMQISPDGWKVYDIVVGGVSLVTNYRETFNAQIRDGGVDGLIKSLADKNRAPDVQASSKPQ